MKSSTISKIAAILGFTGISMGAFGAHALRGFLAMHGMVDIWEKAVFYHMIHAVALCALIPYQNSNRWILPCWTLGTLFFSGSLYALASTGWRPLVFLTPAGGVLLLVGWLALFFSSNKS